MILNKQKHFKNVKHLLDLKLTTGFRVMDLRLWCKVMENGDTNNSSVKV